MSRPVLAFCVLTACALAGHAAERDASPVEPSVYTHLAFVVDTSASMRDPQTNLPWPVTMDIIIDQLASAPPTVGVQVFDAEGRPLLGRNGEWQPNDSALRTLIDRALQRNAAAPSNPLAGVIKAIQAVNAIGASAIGRIVIIGDEFADRKEPFLRKLDQMNPRDRSGHRWFIIDAVQLPTTVRFKGGHLSVNAEKFQDLMQDVVQIHGGTYKLLEDLQRL